MPSTAGEPTNIAYADETHHNVGRYRGIGLVSMRYADANGLGQGLQALLTDPGITEFKWQKLDSETDRKAALKMVRWAVDKACAGVLRLDVLTWDIEDSRHRVLGRDDTANLQRMYYHLFKNVLSARWPDGSIWRLCPDEHTGLKWYQVDDFLDMAGTHVEVRRDLLTRGKLSFRLKQEFGIKEIVPCRSQDEPLVQLADLFVGLGVYSRERYDRYEEWQRSCSQQPSLFRAQPAKPIQLSRSDRERCAVLSELDGLCKRQRLGVSLKTNRGLKTFSPANPANFWWYEPQQEEDKAPVKERR